MSCQSRDAAIRDAIADAAIYFALRCARCDDAELVAVEPSQPQGEPRGYCELLAAVVLAIGGMSYCRQSLAGRAREPCGMAGISRVLSQTFGRDGQGSARRIKSSSERIELLRRTQFARGLQLTFSDHVHDLNAREGDGG